MVPLDLNFSTLVVLVVLGVLTFFSARRMFRNGTCDCHKDAPRSGRASKASACSGCHCSSCAVCPTMGALDKRMDELVKRS